MFVAGRGFLGFGLEQSWRVSGRGGKPQDGAVIFRPGAREVLSGALVEAVILSSARVVSFHSRSGSPFGWVQALRKREKALPSPYFC